MKQDDYERSQGKILRLPASETLRQRLKEKHREYHKRRTRFMRKNRVDGYGVLIGNDDTLLDAHYKEALFSTMLKDGMVRTTRVYQELKKTFNGYMNDAIFNNAVQVLADYVSTGGSYTSGGSGFLDQHIFHDLLGDTDQIRLPKDLRLARQLRKKYHEYLGRIVDHQQHPDLPVKKASLARDAYKARIIDALRNHGSVDIVSLAEELEEHYASSFKYKQFMQAAAVIRSYCQAGGQGVVGGTGL